ncbi:unnamed protein product [Heligmosomoides polygyrus]|uniref:Copper resistance protein CopA n=1 Tax=Heligmosomoides polygyrus TaxID=6339 RepID=A0A183F779_HELPZ|nr:unnamed protein product [Heligmosomoides polygyrus]
MDHNADSTMDQTTMDHTAGSMDHMDRTTVTSDAAASTVHMELSVDPDEEDHVHMPTIADARIPTGRDVPYPSSLSLASTQFLMFSCHYESLLI